MKQLLLISAFIFISSTMFATDCAKYIDEKIKPLEFRGVVLEKKTNTKQHTYILEIKLQDNRTITLEIPVNKNSTDLFNFTKVKSMIKKEKNSCYISVGTPVGNGSIEVNQFSVTCD